jgi:hypothetical protein
MKKAPGLQRFEKQLDILATQLQNSRKEKDCSLALYRTGGRTPLFMLESLARLYRNIHNKKHFSRLYDIFKRPEDMLGAIDYYAAFLGEFSEQKKFPKPLLLHFEKNRDTACVVMNKMMKQEKWSGKKQKRIGRIRKSLKDMDWLDVQEDTSALAGCMIAEIQKIKDELQSGKLTFFDIEKGVHEFRRKLRWLSIYPASLDGLIQLEPQKTIPASLKKYITPEVVNSPFNTFPPKKKGIPAIKYNANHFYALSWMIAELGKIKDAGLTIHALKEALERTGLAEGKTAERKARELCGHKGLKEKDLLHKAQKLAQEFVFKHHVLDRMENDLARYM